MSRLRVASGALAALLLAAAAPPPGPSLPVASLPGLGADDLRAALVVFRRSCRDPAGRAAPGRSAQTAPPNLAKACAAAARIRTRRAVMAFFERHFLAYRIPDPGFFTGYYEPVVAASLTRTERFGAPLYAAPTDLASVTPGAVSGLDPTLNAARRRPDGTWAAMPDRAGIEAGGLDGVATPIAYVRTPADAFFIQVQGSARLRLPDGRLKRLVYAGRNGYPYTSIGKVLRERLGVPPSEMDMARLRAWIAAHGEGRGEAGTKLMQENRAFIFFRFDDSLPPHAGPVGGAGISLTPMRSLAIDRTRWPYGLPFWIDTTLPAGAPLRRMMIAQDTGAAIVGPARADIFVGTGDAAAAQAGPMRQSGRLYVLWPKPPARSR